MPKDPGKGTKRAKATRAPREKKPKPLTPRDLMKLEIADELGFLAKVQTVGWAGLSAMEAGAVGGIMSHRLRRAPQPEATQPDATQPRAT